MEIEKTQSSLREQLKKGKLFSILCLVVFLAGLLLILFNIAILFILDNGVINWSGTTLLTIISKILVMIGMHLSSISLTFSTYKKLKLKTNFKLTFFALLPIFSNIFNIIQINKFLKDYDDKNENIESQVQ